MAPGPLALLCALGYLAHALSAKRHFVHIGWPDAGPWTALRGEMLAGGLLLAGLVLGIRAARRPTGLAARAGVVALALLTPFAVDLALAPTVAWLSSPGARQMLFLTLTTALLVVIAWRWPRSTVTFRPVAGVEQRLAHPARARWLLLTGALLAALLLAEGATRLLGLGPRRLSSPYLVVPGDERRVPLSEVELFRPMGSPSESTGLSARFRPYLFLKGWYDRPRWDYFDEGGHVDYVFNRYGLRDHDFALEPAPDEFRIVAIGDSFTFGVGVQLEDCWTEVLERGLRDRLQVPVEVINAGFASGHQPGKYEVWLLADGVRLQPDVVIVGLCLNDVHRDVPMHAYAPLSRPPQPLGGRSRLLNAAGSAWTRLTVGTPEPVDPMALVRAEPQLWDNSLAVLARLDEALAGQGIRLLVAPFPMLSGLRDRYPYHELLDMVEEDCAEAGIETLDLRPLFLGMVDEDLWVHPTDQHPNDRGLLSASPPWSRRTKACQCKASPCSAGAAGRDSGSDQLPPGPMLPTASTISDEGSSSSCVCLAPTGVTPAPGAIHSRNPDPAGAARTGSRSPPSWPLPSSERTGTAGVTSPNELPVPPNTGTDPWVDRVTPECRTVD
jgi:lysophospholipase L1-like esterase